MKKRSVCIVSALLVAMVFGCIGLTAHAGEKPSKCIKVTSEVISEKSEQDKPVQYDDGMAEGKAYEYCYIKTTSVVRVKGDMDGQPTDGTDRLKNEGFVYVCDDKSTTKKATIDVSLSVGYKVAAVEVSVPINIFKSKGKSKGKVESSYIIAPKKGRYKAYGNITYTVTTYESFKRPDTRKMTKKEKKKVKWVHCCSYKPTTVVAKTDSSKCRYIGEYGKD